MNSTQATESLGISILCTPDISSKSVPSSFSTTQEGSNKLKCPLKLSEGYSKGKPYIL